MPVCPPHPICVEVPTCDVASITRWALQPGQGQQEQELEQKQGRPVQVEPIEPMLKAPGTKRLKLRYDESLSNFAFNFNLHRYNKGNDNKDPFKNNKN